MNTRRQRGQTGASLLEFTLVGIGMIFVLISFFEMARGMWTYQTLGYAVREGTRYAAMHGKNCASPNTCQVTVGQIVSVVKAAGPGLDPDRTTVTLTTNGGVSLSNTMTVMMGISTVWPPVTDYSPGQNVQISASYPFKTVLAMFWAGAGHAVNDSQTFHLGASSTEPIQF